MEKILNEIASLWLEYAGTVADDISKLPQSGSDRMYFRVSVSPSVAGTFAKASVPRLAKEGKATLIATYNDNLKENKTFIAFSAALAEKGCPVCRVVAVNETGNVYLQEDFGDISLLNVLEEKGYTDEVYGLFKQSLKKLAHLQIVGGSGINYDDCLTTREFGKQAIMSDLLYFKYYFLDTLKYPYDKQALLNDFEALSTYLTHTGNKHFMFRDFQSRNIMVQDGQAFIS